VFRPDGERLGQRGKVNLNLLPGVDRAMGKAANTPGERWRKFANKPESSTKSMFERKGRRDLCRYR